MNRIDELINKYEKAMKRIIDGEDHEKVISEMEAEWSEYTHQNRFD